MHTNRGRSSVVKTSEFKSEDPGFDPLEGQGPLNSGADLFVPDSPSCVRHAPKFVCTLKM